MHILSYILCQCIKFLWQIHVLRIDRMWCVVVLIHCVRCFIGYYMKELSSWLNLSRKRKFLCAIQFFSKSLLLILRVVIQQLIQKIIFRILISGVYIFHFCDYFFYFLILFYTTIVIKISSQSFIRFYIIGI